MIGTSNMRRYQLILTMIISAYCCMCVAPCPSAEQVRGGPSAHGSGGLCHCAQLATARAARLRCGAGGLSLMARSASPRNHLAASLPRPIHFALGPPARCYTPCTVQMPSADASKLMARLPEGSDKEPASLPVCSCADLPAHKGAHGLSAPVWSALWTLDDSPARSTKLAGALL